MKTTVNVTMCNTYEGVNYEASLNRNDMLEDKSVFVIATIEDVPVGCGALRKLNDETMELNRMYVSKSGSGVGSYILASLNHSNIISLRKRKQSNANCIF